MYVVTCPPDRETERWAQEPRGEGRRDSRASSDTGEEGGGVGKGGGDGGGRGDYLIVEELEWVRELVTSGEGGGRGGGGGGGCSFHVSPHLLAVGLSSGRFSSGLV